jgi:excisionase family DNA binding protein
MAAQPARPRASGDVGVQSNAAPVDVAAVARAVAAELAAAPPPDALLDAAGAARLLGVPESWVRQEARADRIPHVRLGKYVRFDREALLAWAAGRSRGPRTGSGPVPRAADRR